MVVAEVGALEAAWCVLLVVCNWLILGFVSFEKVSLINCGVVVGCLV